MSKETEDAIRVLMDDNDELEGRIDDLASRIDMLEERLEDRFRGLERRIRDFAAPW